MPQVDSNWYELDNAAKLYPSVSTVTATCVFRLSARMKETVKCEVLQRAAEEILSETPMFQVRMRQGLFWFYLEPNNQRPVVKEESSYPFRRMDRLTNNGFLFDVTYLGQYIHVEFFHALCDGTGALDFLKRLVMRYVKIAHGVDVDLGESSGVESHSAMREDGFGRMVRGKMGKGTALMKQRKAYKPPFTLTQNGEIRVIKGIFSLKELSGVAKRYGVTITALLCGVLSFSYWQEYFQFEPKALPITISIPVNLRKMFPSSTVRNFFTSVYSAIDCFGEEVSLDGMIKKSSENMKQALNPEAVNLQVLYNVNAQKNLGIRFSPLFIKNIVLKMIYTRSEKSMTTALTNLGKVTLPEAVVPYVDRIEFSLWPTMNTRCKLAVCTFEDNVVTCFSSNSENTEVQRRFFLILKELGVDPVISCNMKEDME